MKPYLVIALFLCIATSFAADAVATTAPKSQIPPLPASIQGYTFFNTAAIKKNAIVLNTYTSQTANFAIAAVNKKAFAPASYGVVVRGAYRTPITGGYSIIYYVKAHEPGNPKGKDYYAHYTATVAANGSNKRYVSFVLDKALPWKTK